MSEMRETSETREARPSPVLYFCCLVSFCFGLAVAPRTEVTRLDAVEYEFLKTKATQIREYQKKCLQKSRSPNPPALSLPPTRDAGSEGSPASTTPLKGA